MHNLTIILKSVLVNVSLDKFASVAISFVQMHKDFNTGKCVVVVL